MRVLRWLGTGCMALALVSGAAMLYMRYIVVSNPIWQPPRIQGGTMGGGYAVDQDSAKVFAINVIVSIAFFFVGLTMFIIGGRRQKQAQQATEGKARRKDKRKLQGPPQDSNLN
jgi:hypothetical protein